MSFVLPKPKLITEEEVVLNRSDWERVVMALAESGDDEDAGDIAAVAAARAEKSAWTARLEAERGAPVETTIPMEVVKAELDGAHPIRAWRDYRGWTQSDLAVRSGVARGLIVRLETRRKKGDIETLADLARGLGVATEVLAENDDE